MVPSAGYDPLIDLPMAQAARPAELGPVNLRTLTPFQRALLVIDGTVRGFQIWDETAYVGTLQGRLYAVPLARE